MSIGPGDTGGRYRDVGAATTLGTYGHLARNLGINRASCVQEILVDSQQGGFQLTGITHHTTTQDRGGSGHLGKGRSDQTSGQRLCRC